MPSSSSEAALFGGLLVFRSFGPSGSKESSRAQFLSCLKLGACAAGFKFCCVQRFNSRPKLLLTSRGVPGASLAH